MQKCYLVPAVSRVWARQQQALLQQVRDRQTELTVGGDARCDSPGHNAKYASYSFMDLESNKVVEMQLVQVRELWYSSAFSSVV